MAGRRRDTPFLRPANEFNHRRDISHSERAAFFLPAGVREVPRLEDLTIFPNPGVGIVGSDAAGVGPGVNGKQLGRHGGGDVHRSAVYADRETRRANHPDELQKTGLICQIDAVLRNGNLS